MTTHPGSRFHTAQNRFPKLNIPASRLTLSLQYVVKNINLEQTKDDVPLIAPTDQVLSLKGDRVRELETSTATPRQEVVYVVTSME